MSLDNSAILLDDCLRAAARVRLMTLNHHLWDLLKSKVIAFENGYKKCRGKGKVVAID